MVASEGASEAAQKNGREKNPQIYVRPSHPQIYVGSLRPSKRKTRENIGRHNPDVIGETIKTTRSLTGDDTIVREQTRLYSKCPSEEETHSVE